MEIISLKCNNCGANLDINPNIKFFTCTFCKSSLTIKKSGNVMFTEVLEDIKKDTEALIDNSEEMLIEKKIARLDRDWLVEREQFQLKREDGVVYYPTRNESSNFGNNIILYVGWLIFIAILSSIEQGGGLKLFMLVFGTIVFIFLGFSFYFDKEKGERYIVAKEKYDEKRKILLSQLEK